MGGGFIDRAAVIRAEKAKRLAIRENLKTFLLTSANEDDKERILLEREEDGCECNRRGTNILELSSHVRVMKEKRGREIRRFYFFLEGKVLRNGEEKEKKDSSGNLCRVVSSIESRTIVSLEKKEKLDIIIWISYN